MHNWKVWIALAAALGCSARRAGEATVATVAPVADSRERQALVAGRLHDASSAPALTALLSDAQVGDLAAWALGRIDGGEPALVACLRARCPAAAEAARALGGPGRGPAAISALAAALDGKSALAAEAAVALAIAARMGGKEGAAAVAAAARAPLLSALGRPEVPVRAGAAMALGRLPEDRAQALAPALGAALRDPDELVRAQAARAAGRLGASAAELLPLLADPDWRVRVEAARALPGTKGAAAVIGAALPAATAAAAGGAKWAHALAALLDAAGRAGVELPEPKSLRAPSPAATAAIRCAAAEAHDRAAARLDWTPGCGAGVEPDWRTRLRAGALAAELATSPEAAAYAAAVAALGDPDGRVRGQAAGAAGAALLPLLLKLLEADPDPYVVAEVAGALAKDGKLAQAALPAALGAVQRFSAAKDKPAGPPEVDALVALVQLVAAGRRGAPPPAPDPLRALLPAGSVALYKALAEVLPVASLGAPPALPTPGAAVAGRQARSLVIATTAGELTVALHTGEAPESSAALAGLARRGFYDGLSWHRVVSDFVVQGGDPRGDGDGGPGFTLPDEHSPLRFRRGTMGIATNGPGTETGGSQLFFCHSAEPHLDGRYTVVGELTSGQEVMDALQVSDAIVSVRAE